MRWQDLQGVGDRTGAFDAQHTVGGEGPVCLGSFLWFPDGARRDENPYGLLIEPTEAQEIARNIATYRRALYDRAAKRFEAHKRALEQHLRAVVNQGGIMETPPTIDTEGMRRELNELKALAREAYQEYQAALSRVEVASPEDTARQARSDEARQAAADALNALAGIGL